jgi:hypothetical protein
LREANGQSSPSWGQGYSGKQKQPGHQTIHPHDRLQAERDFHERQSSAFFEKLNGNGHQTEDNTCEFHQWHEEEKYSTVDEQADFHQIWKGLNK